MTLNQAQKAVREALQRYVGLTYTAEIHRRAMADVTAMLLEIGRKEQTVRYSTNIANAKRRI